MSRSDIGIPYDVEIELDAAFSVGNWWTVSRQMPEYANFVQCEPNRSTVEGRAP